MSGFRATTLRGSEKDDVQITMPSSLPKNNISEIFHSYMLFSPQIVCQFN